MNNEQKIKSRFFRNCWIVVDILNLLSETKINYWFKHLLNCNISAILVDSVRTFIHPAYLANKHTQ